MNTPIVKIKGIPVEIGGVIRIVPPLSLGAIQQLQGPLSKFTGDINDMSSIGVVIDAAFSALKRNYPDLTREEVADDIGLENMNEVLEAVMDVSGLKRKTKEAENDAGK